MSKDKNFMIGIGVLIVVAQIIIFLMVHSSGSCEMADLSLVPITCFAFIFGEMPGLFFATAVAICFSPILIDLNMNDSALWVFRTFSFAIVALAIGTMSGIIKKHLNFSERIHLTDIFTGLPNRQALCERLIDMSNLQVSGRFAMVVVIISNKKALSEIFGNDVCKSIFNQFRDRYFELAKEISAEVEIYSLDSDKMAFFFVKNEGEQLESKEFENNLASITKKNFLYNGFFVHGDSHIGLYRFSDFSEINKGEQPLGYAEEAVDNAAKQMKNMVVYDHLNTAQKRVYSNASDILGDIDLAIRNRRMFLVYQPKIAMSTGKIHSVEALIRWNHPTKGFVPPALFIPQAEQSTLIENITDFVIKQAILQLKLWQRSGIYVHIAINVSTYNMLQANFVSKVLNLLQENRLPPECLEVEITEGAMISDFQNVLGGLKRFHDAKIKIALDDFGTGYSSLQYLQQLPIDFLKIDQSFVRNLGTNKESKEIVKAIVDLAHAINVETIAEGIETISDYEYLNSVDCDIGQGYFMSKPLTSNDFVKWYSENNGVFKT